MPPLLLFHRAGSSWLAWSGARKTSRRGKTTHSGCGRVPRQPSAAICGPGGAGAACAAGPRRVVLLLLQRRPLPLSLGSCAGKAPQQSPASQAGRTGEWAGKRAGRCTRSQVAVKTAALCSAARTRLARVWPAWAGTKNSSESMTRMRAWRPQNDSVAWLSTICAVGGSNGAGSAAGKNASPCMPLVAGPRMQAALPAQLGRAAHAQATPPPRRLACSSKSFHLCTPEGTGRQRGT